ncbi:MAG: hypothetical protein ACI9LN_004845 [Saprospiraceae bacterium]|jgi:hypothetical protein
MKRIIPFLAFILLAFCASAQILEITPNPVMMNFEDVDLTDNYIEEIGHYDITNTSSEAVSLRWVRIVSPDCNADWQLPVCDNNQCYSAAVSSNVDANLGLDAPAILQAGEMSDLFSLHVKPKGQAGCCTVKLEFYLANDSSTVLETIDFDIRINDPNCDVVSTSEAMVSALRVFPNPMTDFFQLEGNDGNDVKELVVYNLIGRQVRSFDATIANSFDMVGLPGGIYLVGMVGEDGNIVKTVRISRQIVRP